MGKSNKWLYSQKNCSLILLIIKDSNDSSFSFASLKFMQFLEKLGSIVGLDEVSRELGFDLQTDALLARAEQLTKLEGDRLADKVH